MSGYFKTRNVKIKTPERIVSVEPVNPGKYKYRDYRYFMNFASLDECLDNSLALLRSSAGVSSWLNRHDANEFARR